MTVKIKLICHSKEHKLQTPDHGDITLLGDTNDNEYFKYTPYAYMKLGILNPSAFCQFEPGKTYLVNIDEEIQND